MSNARAVRYRRLVLAEEDKAKADLLLKLAHECDRGILLHRRMAFSSARLQKCAGAKNARRQFAFWVGPIK